MLSHRGHGSFLFCPFSQIIKFLWPLVLSWQRALHLNQIKETGDEQMIVSSFYTDKGLSHILQTVIFQVLHSYLK